MPKVLIIDNNIDEPWPFGRDFRRYIYEGTAVEVRRGPQQDLPKNPGQYSHVVLSGSKTSCMDVSPWVEKLLVYIRDASDQGSAILGVCFGHQMVARAFGGIQAVRKSKMPEIGWIEVVADKKNPILEGLPQKFHSFQLHFDEVASLPSELVATARSERCAIQAYHHVKKPVFGIQFHPEKNAEEGQRSIDSKRKEGHGDCIFNGHRANSLYSEYVANTIFTNFLRINAGKS